MQQARITQQILQFQPQQNEPSSAPQIAKDFGAAYQKLANKMAVEENGGNLLLPTNDFMAIATGMQQEKRTADIGRFEREVERRRERQLEREKKAAEQAAKKELEGCTFAPKLATKKARQSIIPTDPAIREIKQNQPQHV